MNGDAATTIKVTRETYERLRTFPTPHKMTYDETITYIMDRLEGCEKTIMDYESGDLVSGGR